ncbi:class I SAM-dependent methyltransferase [Methanosarcina sp.]|uniref:class I SAM-dependent methyltransferase n=1 Tax=Methanosarcina sp. TaxID=2213 RepID=UPI0029892D53|nr:methyltransferase domain-containing protein [Methanosarcina sp.]MDW5550383.1 methyltransferase domain-containing protein [Methanosarcina sp.]MDW5554707.1 methyltransferase domain-containing protein [Methanosarcina sp.]MDW5560494.1 methyltransferase domain-containing protein [Methanosarcina sp.]
MSEIDWDTPESAKIYDQNCDHQFQKGQTLIRMMKIKNGDSVLDIGCGTGWQALNVSEIIGPSGKLTCIDPSSYRIELARKKFGVNSSNNIRFLVGQAEDLSSIPDNSINHAYFCSSFHWVDDKKIALSETYRVLKPGGSIGMTTLDRDSPNTMRKLVDPILAKYNITRSFELHKGINRVNAVELHNLLSEAGFTSISIESRMIPRQHRSPEEFLKRLEERDSSRNLLTDIPDEIKEKIKQEIYEEYIKIQNSTFAESGIVTLFAIATKPNE